MDPGVATARVREALAAVDSGIRFLAKTLFFCWKALTVRRPSASLLAWDDADDDADDDANDQVAQLAPP